MSETTETAWEPNRAPLKVRKQEIILTESDPEFIGPRTTGDFREEALCEECMGGFMAGVFIMNLKEMFRSKYCPECLAKHDKEEAAKSHRPKSRLEKWAEVCPPAYLKTDVDRLRKENRLKTRSLSSAAFVDRILSRPYSERGLGFCGDSRLGKTRLMFSLLGKYFLDGKRVMYLYAPDFSDTYAALMGESASKGNAYLESCINAEAWFLDDLGKGRLSESAQRALLRVIEKRTNSERPIFLTCNEDGEMLIKRMRYEDGGESEYARPMIERIREFCDFYDF